MGLLARLSRLSFVTGVAGAVLLSGCQSQAQPDAKPTQILLPEPEVDMTGPVVDQPWDAVRIGTYDNAEFARLFTEIGGYSVLGDTANRMILQREGAGARIVLEQLPPEAPQARPADAQSWEPGCYWSLMMRARNVPSIVEDAEALGWLPKTPVAYLEFGPSKLNVVVLSHQATGAQVQLYERLTTPLPDDYPEFERFGVPFNIMQMASDRDATYAMFKDVLGFSTWYHGDPYVSGTQENMPLGIPPELTTTVPYRASIVSPVEGMETGRFEMIEIMGETAGLSGRNFSQTCTNQSVGLTEVIYEVPHTRPVVRRLEATGAKVTRAKGPVLIAPDGARIRFQHAD